MRPMATEFPEVEPLDALIRELLAIRAEEID
jgi:hypothetical protein